MTTLFTHFKLSQQQPAIDYNSQVLLLGSCFTEHIGDKLEYYKFQQTQNPFGILFQPEAITNLISRVFEQRYFTESDIFQQEEQWHCLEVHSLISHKDKNSYLDVLNGKLETLKEALLTSSHIVITLGTAWIYYHLNTDKRVANCHKLPQREFQKQLLEISAIVKSLRDSEIRIREQNESATIIYTVSPVRHLKDGFVENMRSKAHLLAAVHQAIEISGQSYYFPSYELMMDELRDYRFYKPDLLHPNETAISIIWERFSDAWLSEEALGLQKEVGAIQAALQHRPFHPESKAHQEFLADLQKRIVAVQKEYPHIRF